jgi:hypothetical protein
MKTIIFGFTILIAMIAPIAKYLLTFSGLGGMYGEFWKQFPPSAYISTTLILHYVISFGLAYLLFIKLNLKDRIPHPLAGQKLIWIGGLITIAPSFLRIFTSMIQGGGASFALMSVSAPFVLGGKILFFIGIFILLLAIKPSEKYSYE